MNKTYKAPEILYEVSAFNETVSKIPYIEVEKNAKMPPCLFIFEYKQTDEFELDQKGNKQMVYDQIPHQFVDLESLKDKLPPHLNDLVRVALGMKPLKEAQGSGQDILDKAKANAEKIREGLLKQKAEAESNKSKKNKDK